ncbi:hypothetical protein [Ruminococcus sp.]|uniref:hypothetical protein n=1 Tax=Ruminococcus sp. TaxID=41978 RepID=UPI003AB1853B
MSVGHLIQLTLNYPPKNKKVYSIFSKIAGLGSAHKIFQYKNLLSGANSHAVCVLKLSLLKKATAIKKPYFIDEITNFFSYCYRFLRLTPLYSSRQTARCLAIVRLQKRKVFVGFAHTHNL